MTLLVSLECVGNVSLGKSGSSYGNFLWSVLRLTYSIWVLCLKGVVFVRDLGVDDFYRVVAFEYFSIVD